MEGIIEEQTKILEAMKRLLTNYKKDGKQRKTEVYFENKLDFLQTKMTQFNANHNLILQNREEGVKYETYIKGDLTSQVEDFFVESKIQLQEDWRAARPKPTVSTETTTPTATVDGVSEKKVQPTQVEREEMSLPRINIPKFVGDYRLWMSFHDLFTTLIHNNKHLTNVQKLHYLKACTQGEAEQLIRHFTITETNYEPAWDLLRARYDNKRILIKTQLKILFSQPAATTESAYSLRKLVDTTNECVQALKNLGVNTDNWGIIFTYLVSERLPVETKKLWEQEIGIKKEFPKFDELQTFVEGQFRALESISNQKPNTMRWGVAKSTFYIANSYSCPICKGGHPIRQCNQFLNVNHQGRRDLVIQRKLCSNCLARGHVATSCPSRSSCFKCKRRHHTLLHDDSYGEKLNRTGAAAVHVQPNTTTAHVAETEVQHVDVLLATALVKVISNSGREEVIRALIDQGSQSTFITESAVKRIRLRTTPVSTTILGLGNINAGRSAKRAMCQMQSLHQNDRLKIEALVLKNLTTIMPQTYVKAQTHWPHLKDIILADPEYFKPGHIDMIIGADVFCRIILAGLRTGPQGAPIAQQTTLGWILSGEINQNISKQVNISAVHHISVDSNEQLRKFWEIEEIQEEQQLSVEDKVCEEYYNKTTTRLSDGRYVVRLPFKGEEMRPQFGKSRCKALSRFKSLEKSFFKEEEVQKEYSMCMQEYSELNHMVPTSTSEIENMCHDGQGVVHYNSNYLPHHAVKKESTTTKLRVVFDASSKTINGPSLNDTLLTGPKLQENLAWILMRWRKYAVVLTADIEKMYRQIWMNQEDAEYQRVLWRKSPDEDITDYKLQTVTFGTTSAPYLAVRTLQQLAKDESKNYPLASKVMLSDFYVDDLLTGVDSIDHGLVLQDQLIHLLKTGGLNLRKWASNKEALLNNMSLEDREISGVIKFDETESVKTLGVNWYPKTDCFKYRVSGKFEGTDTLTKRQFLSHISKMFDPLGFLAPLIIKLKMMMQIIWIKGIEWDEKIPVELQTCWNNIVHELPLIEQLEIPRWLRTTANVAQLHGFCDGSLHAYAAVIYARTTDEFGSVNVQLLTAKTKVTPVKQITLPRIELCGAVLLVKLYRTVKEAMKFDEVSFVAWSDSTIVLSWIKGHPGNYKTFVGNRIAEIQKSCTPDCWRHVPTKDNPADMPSRGCNPKDLVNSSFWWSGPDWLKMPKEEWPNRADIIETTDHTVEMKRPKTVLIANTEQNPWDCLIDRCSSFTKLLRSTAYCFRFIRLCKRELHMSIYLTTAEINKARKFWLHRAQQVEFQQDIKNIETESSKNGALRSLNPFLDGDKILRVGGRLKNANIPYDEKHPVILPTQHKITTLIINNIHKITLHGGVQLMTSVLRQQYWIINARRVMKQHIYKCVTCFRQRAETQQQLMGSLPEVRVLPARPFQHTGVDYCGPMEIKTSKLRTSKMSKGYLAIFICLSTRAVHIEVVSELTSASFIAAFRRFIGRRGVCTKLYSDNGTNFVGARKILTDKFQQHIRELHHTLPEIAINENVDWHFIPPASPHFGGLWEAAVKSTKYHLKRVVGNSMLTFEELTTVVIQIEACLNSRPICPLTQDPEDMSVLTPGHFLVGSPLLALPEPSQLPQGQHNLNRWQYMQRLVQTFWEKWHTQYLNNLQQRPKWTYIKKNLEVNNMVLIKEDNLPPSKWLLGRIIEIHPGSDDIVRVVTIKTKDSILKRAITKVCMLPIEDNYGTTTSTVEHE